MLSTPENKEQLYQKMNLERSGKIHISFSEFSLFNECGHKHLIFKHLKLDEQPQSIHLFFGNAIHAAIETSFLGQTSLPARIELFRSTFRKNMLDNLKEDVSFKEVDDYIDQGENILKTLDAESIFNDYEVVSVEEDLYEPVFGNFYFKGFIDLML